MKKCACCHAVYNSKDVILRCKLNDHGLWFDCDCGSTLLSSMMYKREIRYGMEVWAVYVDNEIHCTFMSEEACVVFIKQLKK